MAVLAKAPEGAVPELVRDLLRAEAFPHPASDLRLVETHISWVILAGSYAYKLKKPVNFGFLDFSTPERRRLDCLEEVRLNRRLCPELYLGVVDVVRRAGTYAIGLPGDPVETAVCMRRLPERGMLPALLARGAVDERFMARVARRLADFHAHAATGPGIDEYGSVEVIGANWTENFEQVEPFLGRTLRPDVLDSVRTYAERFLFQQRPLLERRIRDGRIREGHGDLHAGSVCRAGRKLYLFDCIEFNPRFRCSDVASDIAFLSMDLSHLGRADLAHALLDAYVRVSGDHELRDLLAFYTCYRAYVRGKVLSFRLDQPTVGSDLAAIGAEAGAYFDLAWAAAGGLRGPMLVVTMGLPASGKTTLARGLAGRFGFVHLSSDVVRKRLVGLRATEHRLERFGRGLYSRANSQQTYAGLRRQAMGWLRQGQSVLLDATYGQPHERVALRRLAQRAGVPLVVLICQADEATLRSRLAARPNDSLTTSDARLSLWPALRAAYMEPCEWPEAVRVDTTQLPDVSLTDALSIIRRARPPLSA